MLVYSLSSFCGLALTVSSLTLNLNGMLFPSCVPPVTSPVFPDYVRDLLSPPEDIGWFQTQPTLTSGKERIMNSFTQRTSRSGVQGCKLLIILDLNSTLEKP